MHYHRSSKIISCMAYSDIGTLHTWWAFGEKRSFWQIKKVTTLKRLFDILKNFSQKLSQSIWSFIRSHLRKGVYSNVITMLALCLLTLQERFDDKKPRKANTRSRRSNGRLGWILFHGKMYRWANLANEHFILFNNAIGVYIDSAVDMVILEEFSKKVLPLLFKNKVKSVHANYILRFLKRLSVTKFLKK